MDEAPNSLLLIMISAQGVPQRVVHVMHNSEQPASCFCVLDTSTCLIADNLMGLLMLKLKGNTALSVVRFLTALRISAYYC